MYRTLAHPLSSSISPPIVSFSRPLTSNAKNGAIYFTSSEELAAHVLSVG